MRLIRGVVVVMIMLVSLAAIVSAEDIAGTWESIEYYRNGKALPEMVGKARYEFNEDGTYTHNMGRWLTAKGTYTVEQGKVLLVSDIGGKTDISLDEGRIIVENTRTRLKIIYEKSE